MSKELKAVEEAKRKELEEAQQSAQVPVFVFCPTLLSIWECAPFSRVKQRLDCAVATHPSASVPVWDSVLV